MDIAKGLTYVTEDERWVSKLLIALVVSFFSFLIFPAFFLFGYAIAITKNVKDGVEKPLPEWEDWGKLFMDGLYVFIAQFVYTLPFIIVFCIAFAASGVMGAAADSGGDLDLLMALIGPAILIMICLSFLYVIALVFISPAIIIQYVLSGDNFGATFRFGEVFGIARSSIVDILIVMGVMGGIFIALFVVTFVLNIIPCLGQIVALLIGLVVSPYMTAVTGHLYGQIAAKYVSGKEKFVG